MGLKKLISMLSAAAIIISSFGTAAVYAENAQTENPEPVKYFDFETDSEDIVLKGNARRIYDEDRQSNVLYLNGTT